MKTNNDYIVFILTHGRPDNVITYKTLKDCGYKGKVVFVIDNEDKTKDKYIENFGINNIEIFDKKLYADSIDEANNFDERRTITHARNACFDIAKKLGYEYFIELDDDYISFEYRKIENDKLKVKKVKSLSKIFNYYFEIYKSMNVLTFAFAQGGDYVGGANNPLIIKRIWKRKAMNSFFCSTLRPFKFVGAMNEDVNTYTTLGMRGKLFFSIPLISLTQKPTQSQKGGITDMYLKFGTLSKSFTTVMMCPSSVKATYQIGMGRIHHLISWNNTVPKILNEKYKKLV